MCLFYYRQETANRKKGSKGAQRARGQLFHNHIPQVKKEFLGVHQVVSAHERRAGSGIPGVLAQSLGQDDVVTVHGNLSEGGG